MQPAAASEVIAERYRLGGRLGLGGMGEVREGVDLRLGRPVAIKLLRADLAAQPELRRRFGVEAKAAAGLSHPNVVAVYDTGDHEGVPYIVMERLGGRTLADEIADGPLGAGRVTQVAGELLAALGAAHRAGILHRDVKPGNVLLTPEGSVKVADFGIAKVAEGLGPDVTVTGEVLGTPAYLAPERLEGRPATAHSDVFAVGVVLYEALSGARPFEGATPWEVAQAISAGRHRRLDEIVAGVAPTLVGVVERAMATDPEDRFATAEEMAGALVAATATAAATTDPTEPMPAATAPAPATVGGQRRSWRVPLVLALAAAVVALLVVLAVAGGDSSPPPASAPTSTAPASTSLPAELDRALDRLEESVRP